MVKLYGINHGMTISYGFFIPESRSLPITPSSEFLADLESLPKGSRIGLECFDEGYWDCIKTHLKSSAEKSGFFGYSFYTDLTQSYWDNIVEFLRKIGHEPIFLEDKEAWKRYNKATIDLVRLEKKELFFEDGESDYHYHGKLVRHNERGYKAEIVRRKIHEIERDTKLLEAVKSNAPNAIIVGQGHSDYWIANQNRIEDEFGITFEDYSTDTPITGMINKYSMSTQSMFTRKAVPNSRLVYERESLERALRLIEQGRIISDRTPEYVGIWDVLFPSKGYFEMFVERRDNGRVSGKIEDSLGIATFEGIITPAEFYFVKQYVVSEETAIQEPIEFKSKKKDHESYGHFFIRGQLGDAFYLTQSPKMNPVNMSLRWHRLQDVERKKVK